MPGPGESPDPNPDGESFVAGEGAQQIDEPPRLDSITEPVPAPDDGFENFQPDLEISRRAEESRINLHTERTRATRTRRRVVGPINRFPARY